MIVYHNCHHSSPFVLIKIIANEVKVIFENDIEGEK